MAKLIAEKHSFASVHTSESAVEACGVDIECVEDSKCYVMEPLRIFYILFLKLADEL